MDRNSVRHAATEAVKSAHERSGGHSWAHASGWVELDGVSERRISCVVVCRAMSRWFADLLPRLSDQLTEAGFPWELTCVDVAPSSDATVELMAAWIETPGFRWIRLPRHADQATAELFGLRQARGDAVLLINTDVKPALDLPRMVSRWVQGHEVVLMRQDDAEHAPRLFAWNPHQADEPTSISIQRRLSSGTDLAVLLDRRLVDRLLSVATT